MEVVENVGELPAEDVEDILDMLTFGLIGVGVELGLGRGLKSGD